MFSDAQTVTIASLPYSMPRVSFGDRKGVFEDTVGNRLSLSHTFGRRNRHVLRLDHTKTAADPLLDGVSKPYSMSVQLLIDIPPVGYSVGEQLNETLGLVAWCTSPNLTRLIGGES